MLCGRIELAAKCEWEEGYCERKAGIRYFATRAASVAPCGTRRTRRCGGAGEELQARVCACAAAFGLFVPALACPALPARPPTPNSPKPAATAPSGEEGIGSDAATVAPGTPVLAVRLGKWLWTASCDCPRSAAPPCVGGSGPHHHDGGGGGSTGRQGGEGENVLLTPQPAKPLRLLTSSAAAQPAPSLASSGGVKTADADRAGREIPSAPKFTRPLRGRADMGRGW